MQAHRTPARRTAQRGLTLIELMISLAIGLFIMAAASAIFVTSARTSKVSVINTQLNEDGALALAVLTQQIRQAGYSQRIQSGKGDDITTNFHGAPVRGCSGGFTATTARKLPLTDVLCDAGGANDALIVRYEADASNTIATIDGKPTNCNGASIPALAAPAAIVPASGAPAPAKYPLADNRYWLSGTTLQCAGLEGSLTNAAIGAPQPLIENVEQFVLRYGVAAKPELQSPMKYDTDRQQIVSYLSAAEIAALPATTASAAAGEALFNDRWGRVRSVKVCLLLRSDQPLRDADAPDAYTDCNGTAQAAPTDGYMRRAFTTTIALRNRMPLPSCRAEVDDQDKVTIPEDC